MRYGKHQFSSKFSDEAILPGYRGLTLCGILGHAVKKENLLRCLIRKKCVHEKSSPSPVINKISIPASSPFHLIETPTDSTTHYRTEESFDFALLLPVSHIHHMNRSQLANPDLKKDYDIILNRMR